MVVPLPFNSFQLHTVEQLAAETPKIYYLYAWREKTLS